MMSTFSVKTRDSRAVEIPIDKLQSILGKALGIDLTKTYMSFDLTHSALTVKWTETGTKDITVP